MHDSFNLSECAANGWQLDQSNAPLCGTWLNAEVHAVFIRCKQQQTNIKQLTLTFILVQPTVKHWLWACDPQVCWYFSVVWEWSVYRVTLWVCPTFPTLDPYFRRAMSCLPECISNKRKMWFNVWHAGGGNKIN